MQLNFYVNYKDNCREAFEFYEKLLGGKTTSITTFGQMPGINVPEERKNLIVHARMEIGGSILMGADIANAESMRSSYLTLTFSEIKEAEKIYYRLSEGGEIFMKMEKTSFAERFAMLRDRFGANWMILCQ